MKSYNKISYSIPMLLYLCSVYITIITPDRNNDNNNIRD